MAKKKVSVKVEFERLKEIIAEAGYSFESLLATSPSCGGGSCDAGCRAGCSAGCASSCSTCSSGKSNGDAIIDVKQLDTLVQIIERLKAEITPKLTSIARK